MYLISIFISYLYNDNNNGRKEEIIAVLEKAINRYIDRNHYHERIIKYSLGPKRVIIVLNPIESNHDGKYVRTIATKLLKQKFEDVEIMVTGAELRWWEQHTKLLSIMIGLSSVIGAAVALYSLVAKLPLF